MAAAVRLPPPPPTLSGSDIVLTWTRDPRVPPQKTTSLATADWQDVPDSEGLTQLELPRTNATAFFRLVKP